MSSDFNPRDLPIAQKRTSRHKKFVYVTDQFVFKGPYSPTDRSYTLAKLNLALLKILQEALAIPTDQRTHLDILEEIEGPDGHYLKFPNVGSPVHSLKPVVASSKIDTERKILPRGSFVRRASDYESMHSKLPPNLAKQMLQHLYLLYLLGVGDVGSHNILIRAGEKSVVGIDLEEMRKQAPAEDVFFALFGSKRAGIGRKLYASLVASKCFGYFRSVDESLGMLIDQAGGDSRAIKRRVAEFLPLM